MSLTSPWDARAEDAVRQTIRHVVTAHATHPTWSEPVPLDVVGGTVTFDETWAPHVQATLTCTLPPDPDVLALLDPRSLVRIVVEVGYTYSGDVQDVHRLVNLGLRARAVRRPAGQMVLDAASDEALVQDSGPLLDDVLNAPVWDLAEAIAARLPVALGYTPTIVNTVPRGMYVSAWLDSTTDHWPTFKEWADTADAWLYDRGDRTWVLCPRPTAADQPVHLLKVGSAGTVVESESTLSRETWANLVRVTHEWTATDGTPQAVSGRAWLSDPVHGGWNPSTGRPLPGLRAYHERRDTPSTSSAATWAARAILTRRLRAAVSTTVNARSAYWVRPGRTVEVRLPSGGAERHLVSTVAFDLATCLMTLTTRRPDNTSISTGA